MDCEDEASNSNLLWRGSIVLIPALRLYFLLLRLYGRISISGVRYHWMVERRIGDRFALIPWYYSHRRLPLFLSAPTFEISSKKFARDFKGCWDSLQKYCGITVLLLAFFMSSPLGNYVRLPVSL